MSVLLIFFALKSQTPKNVTYFYFEKLRIEQFETFKTSMTSLDGEIGLSVASGSSNIETIITDKTKIILMRRAVIRVLFLDLSVVSLTAFVNQLR